MYVIDVCVCVQFYAKLNEPYILSITMEKEYQLARISYMYFSNNVKYFNQCVELLSDWIKYMDIIDNYCFFLFIVTKNLTNHITMIC